MSDESDTDSPADQPDDPEAEDAPAGEGAGEGAEGTPSEEEIRRRLEEEIRNLRVQDILLQSVVSLINLSSRRIAKEDERDLEQARIGIEAVRGVVDLLDPEPADQVRNALSELQIAYAREAGEGGPSGDESGGAEARDASKEAEGGGESDLWTPPGSS